MKYFKNSDGEVMAANDATTSIDGYTEMNQPEVDDFLEGKEIEAHIIHKKSETKFSINEEYSLTDQLNMLRRIAIANHFSKTEAARVRFREHSPGLEEEMIAVNDFINQKISEVNN